MQALSSDGFITLLDIQRHRSYSLFPSLVELQKQAEGLNYQLRYAPVQTPGGDALREIEGAAGVFVTGWLDEDWAAFLELIEVPVVVIGANPFPDRFATVTYDWAAASRLLVEHFVAIGCKRLGLLNGSADYYPAQMMNLGFQAALEEHQLAISDKQVIWPNYKFIYEHLDAFLQEGQFDAIIVESGAIYSVLNWCWNHQPAKLPVMGVIGDAATHSHLIAKPAGRIVKAVFNKQVYSEAVDLFCDVVNYGNEAMSIVLKPHLQLQ